MLNSEITGKIQLIFWTILYFVPKCYDSDLIFSLSTEIFKQVPLTEAAKAQRNSPLSSAEIFMLFINFFSYLILGNTILIC